MVPDSYCELRIKALNNRFEKHILIAKRCIEEDKSIGSVVQKIQYLLSEVQNKW